MRRLLILLPLFCFLLLPKTNSASHILGGEITWECQSDGRYVFYAKVYRDCTGISFSFSDNNLEIVGNPLPRTSASGNNISSILMRPDSGVWVATNFGDITPNPNGSCDSTNQISCNSGSPGAVQQHPFKSDPIRLYGTPPSSGWKFYFSQACCRPIVTNLAGGGTMMLRASLYAPAAANSNPGNCYESSAGFFEAPDYFFCRGTGLTNQFAAYDLEGDSLVFSLDRTYNTPPAAPQPVPYAPSYSPSNPTPDSDFDARNRPTSLNSRNGLVDFAVYSGSPAIRDYLVVVKVDAYRDQQLISTTQRELPIVLADCPTLPNNQINQSPSISLDGKPNTLELDVRAGSLIQIPVQVSDLDSNGSLLQSISLTTYGSNYAGDLQTANLCDNPPCAVFINRPPTYNVNLGKFEFTDTASVSTTFNWQTECNHAGNAGKTKTYRFYFEAKDDHCPIPQIEHANLIINVFPREIGIPGAICGEYSQSGLDLFWEAGNIDSSTFINWRIYKRVNNSSFTLVDSLPNFTSLSYTDTNYNDLFTSEYKVSALSTGCGANRQSRFSRVFSESYLDSIIVTQNSRTLSTSNLGSYQWYDCTSSSIVPEANSSTYTPPVGDSGLYALILYRGDCVDTSDCYYVSRVGLGEFDLNSKIKIYPNPTRGVIFLEGIDMSMMRYQLFDLQGKLMEEGQINPSQRSIELPDSNGIYFLKLQDERGNSGHFKLIRN